MNICPAVGNWSKLMYVFMRMRSISNCSWGAYLRIIGTRTAVPRTAAPTAATAEIQAAVFRLMVATPFTPLVCRTGSSSSSWSATVHMLRTTYSQNHSSQSQSITSTWSCSSHHTRDIVVLIISAQHVQHCTNMGSRCAMLTADTAELPTPCSPG